VQVRASCVAGRADEAYREAGGNAIADAHVDPREVRVHGADAVGVRDRHEAAPAARAATGPHHATRPGGADGSSGRGTYVDAGMEAASPGPEAVFERPVQWPPKSDRRYGERSSQRGERQVAGAAVDREVRPPLEAANRDQRAGPEVTVQGARWKPVPGEQKLKSGHVPAHGGACEDAAAEWVPPESSERGAVAAVDDAVYRHAGPTLEAPNGGSGLRPRDAVDRARVETASLERDLERGHARVAHRRGRAREAETRQSGKGGDPGSGGAEHGPIAFAAWAGIPGRRWHDRGGHWRTSGVLRKEVASVQSNTEGEAAMKMPSVRTKRPSPAMVVACIALAAALAPASYATVSLVLPRDSVGTAQLKKNAVTSLKVRDFSLRKWDLKQSDLRSLRGPAGPQGPPGVVGTITLRQASITVPAGAVAQNGAYVTRAIQIACQSGERAIAGGTEWSSDANDEELVTVYSKPLVQDGKPVGWRARGGSDIGADRIFTVVALCSQG
jgi:hypothetical protein